MTSTDAPILRIVIFREAEMWLAQGLEHDIGLQGENLRDLVARLCLTLGDTRIAPSILDLEPAPKYFQDLWGLRAGDFTPQQALPTALPGGLTCVLGLVS